MAKRNSKENGVQIPFSEQEFIDKWQEWLQYRKERRLANYVPTGLKMTFTKLIKDCGNDYKIAIQIIDQAIAFSWQGLYPLKINTNVTNITNNPSNNQPKPGTSEARIKTAKNW